MTTPSTESRRQAVLGRSARNLDWLEEIVDHCHPGDSGSLASGWVSVVLELAFSKSAYWRKKTIDQGTSRFDFSYGDREPVSSAETLDGHADRCSNQYS